MFLAPSGTSSVLENSPNRDQTSCDSAGILWLVL